MITCCWLNNNSLALKLVILHFPISKISIVLLHWPSSFLLQPTVSISSLFLCPALSDITLSELLSPLNAVPSNWNVFPSSPKKQTPIYLSRSSLDTCPSVKSPLTKSSRMNHSFSHTMIKMSLAQYFSLFFLFYQITSFQRVDSVLCFYSILSASYRSWFQGTELIC